MIFRQALVLFLALIFILGFAKGRYLLVEVESDPKLKYECTIRGSPTSCGQCPRGHENSCVLLMIGYCGTCQMREVHKKKECAVDKDCRFSSSQGGLNDLMVRTCIKGVCEIGVPTSHPPVKKLKKQEGESCGFPWGPMGGQDCGECDDGLKCGPMSPSADSCGTCYKKRRKIGIEERLAGSWSAPGASRTSCRSARDCGTRRQCCSGVCKVLC